MAYAITKKQNRILLIALVLLLAAAAVLIALTGSANKTKEERPPLDNTSDETQETAAPETVEDTFGKLFGKTEETDAPETDAPETEAKKPASVETDHAAEVSAEPKNVLPTFIVPVNGTAAQGHTPDIPVFSATMNDYRTHTGVDILCSTGSTVVAPASGTIGQVWEDPMMGICLNIIHSGGAVTTFKGLAAETLDFIEAGTEVKKGQAVASSGTTALIECGEEPHIHMELTINGEQVDPAEYMSLTVLSNTFEG